ncbi:MAG: Permease, partial [Bryobacterales bacterium]|nr:Permease [Bryobacterales bacterium]
MTRLFTNLAGDLKYARRQLRRQPGSAFTAVLVLALGIGSSTAAFSVLYEALLRPLPYPDAQRLFRIHNALPKNQVAVAGVSAFDYAEIRERRDVFESAGIFYWNDLTLTGEGLARHIDAVNASATLFSVLGVKPLLGRTYSAEEDRYGAPRTVVLSEQLWRDAFGADPQIAGRSIHLSGMLYTVTGVMPRGFDFPSHATQLWIPVAFRPGAFTVQGGRTEKWLHMLARLAPRVSEQRAEAALGTIGDGLAASFPRLYPKNEGWHFVAKRLAEENTESIRRWLYLAFGAVFSVLLIACVNVSGLLLIRAVARNREVAVRMALGATRFRIVRQILTETAVLVSLACVLGLFCAVWGVHLINLYGPLPRPTPVQGWTLLFGFALALMSTVGAGLLPALLSAD